MKIAIHNLKYFIRGVFIFITYLSLILGSTREYEKLKYIGLVLIIILIWSSVLRKNINKSKLLIGVFIVLISTIGVIFTELTFKQFILMVIYYFVLITISFYGNHLFKYYSDFRYCLFGLITGVLFILLQSSQEIWYQIQILPIYTNRIRIYGKFNHANTFGYICVSILICLLISNNLIFREKFNKKSNHHMINASIYIIFIILMYLTNCRGAIIFFISIIILQLYMVIKSKIPSDVQRILFSFLFFSILVLGGAYFLNNYLLMEATIQNRLEAFSEVNLQGINIIVGNGMVGSNSIDYTNITGYMEIAWLNIYYKAGLIGILVFNFLFFRLYYLGSKCLEGYSKLLFKAILFSFFISTFVESLIVNIFNCTPLLIWPLLSSICYGDFSKKTNNKISYRKIRKMYI